MLQDVDCFPIFALNNLKPNMKKTFFAVLACLGFLAAQAQFEQGKILISGSSGFSLSSLTTKAKTGNTTTKTQKSTSISLDPRVGYFVIDNLALGAGISVSTAKYTNEVNDSESKSTSFSFGPFARYYFQPGIFGEGSVGFGSGKSEYTNGPVSNTSKYSTFNLGLGVGYAAFISDNVAIEPLLKYVSYSEKPNGGNTKTIDAGITLNIGITVYLGK